MWMFDTVEIDKDIKCPHCWESLQWQDFQTKEMDCELTTYLMSNDSINYCYWNCNKCNQWVDIKRIPEKFEAS